MAGKRAFLWSIVLSIVAAAVVGATAALAWDWQPVNFGWANVRNGEPDQNYEGAPQPGTMFIWVDGNSVGAQAEYFFWDSSLVKSDWDPKLDWTHDQGVANYQNYGSDVPNEGVDAWDDNGSLDSLEEVELRIIEANVEVGRTYRYFRVDWSGSSGSGKPNISYEWGAPWDRGHDWLEGQGYGGAARLFNLPLGARQAFAANGKPVVATFEGRVLQGQATLKAVKYQDGQVRGRVRWNVASADARASHATTSRAFAQQLVAKEGSRIIPVTVSFNRALQEQDVREMVARTGLRIKHVYAGGANSTGSRFSAGTVADNQGRFDVATLIQILADGGARYLGITGLEGEISSSPSTLSALLTTRGVSDVDASAVEAQEMLAQAFDVPVELVRVTIPSPHWYVSLE
ncbi:MAG: hypothetical protein M0T85_00885 [Dehalococcoidales bacterium]|nr:hypothetical protein [Dehalococcoidales bacterium]